MVIRALSDLLPDDAVISLDCGANTHFAARCLKLRANQRLTGTGMLASMAPGLSYGIAAKYAFPDRPSVVIAGDGGFSMLMAELVTATSNKLPVKIILLKNNSLAEVKFEQEDIGNPEFGCELAPIDFVAFAKACGAEGYRCERPEDVVPAIKSALKSPRTALVEPGQAALLDLAGERNGDLVVKSPVAIPVSLQPVGNFASFPGSLMGTVAYVRQVWLDTNWSTKAEAVYEKNPRGMVRPRYDRTETALADALEDHALVLIPANNTVQIRRSFELVDRWHVNGVLYGGQMGYAVADEIAAKKLPVIVDLKWPEADKDGDPEAVPSLRTLRFRNLAPSTPAALAKSGVKFGFYSGGIAAPKDILKAVKKSIDAGLSSDAALRALTLAPAEIFGVADRLGSIENGKIANLVIADGDLFNEKTKIRYVFVDGRRFEIREPEKPKDPPKGDLTGKWTLKYTTPEGAEESTLDVTMASDGTLSGSTSGKRGTANIVSGSLSADKFTFTINILIEGSPSDVVFSGTFDGTALKGNINVQSVGIDIEFTGAKASASPPSAVTTLGVAQ